MASIIENKNLKVRTITQIFLLFLFSFSYGQQKEIFIESILISDESKFKNFNSISLEIKSSRSSNTIYNIDTLKNFHFTIDSTAELFFYVDTFLLMIDKPFYLLEEDSMIQKWIIDIKNRSECTMVAFGCFGPTYDYYPLCSIGKRELNLVSFICIDKCTNYNKFTDIKYNR